MMEEPHWRHICHRRAGSEPDSPEPSPQDPFEATVESLAGEEPQVLLNLLDLLPSGASVKVTPLRPKAASPFVFPDNVAILAVDSDDPFTFHVEIQLDYTPDTADRMARHGVRLALRDDRRVVSVLVLLHPANPDVPVPTSGQIAIGRTSATNDFRVVKLWEM